MAELRVYEIAFQTNSGWKNNLENKTSNAVGKRMYNMIAIQSVQINEQQKLKSTELNKPSLTNLRSKFRVFTHLLTYPVSGILVDFKVSSVNYLMHTIDKGLPVYRISG